MIYGGRFRAASPWTFASLFVAKRGKETVFVYAVVKSGGKQYKVAASDVIRVEKLDAAPGETVELTDVLMVSDGDKLTIGTPLVAGAKVTATVVAQGKGRKIHALTYKHQKRVQRHYGHRQLHTELRIQEIKI